MRCCLGCGLACMPSCLGPWAFILAWFGLCLDLIKLCPWLVHAFVPRIACLICVVWMIWHHFLLNFSALSVFTLAHLSLFEHSSELCSWASCIGQCIVHACFVFCAFISSHWPLIWVWLRPIHFGLSPFYIEYAIVVHNIEYATLSLDWSLHCACLVHLIVYACVLSIVPAM